MSKHPPRILIVEEAADIRRLQVEIVKRLFRPLHAEIVAVASVGDAVEQFRKDPFHLLLVDVSVQQDLDGIRELVHASHTRQRCPAIAFSTGRIDRQIFKMLAQDHCFAILPKPFEPEELIDAINGAMKDHAERVDLVISPVLHGIMRVLHPEGE